MFRLSKNAKDVLVSNLENEFKVSQNKLNLLQLDKNVSKHVLNILIAANYYPQIYSLTINPIDEKPFVNDQFYKQAEGTPSGILSFLCAYPIFTLFEMKKNIPELQSVTDNEQILDTISKVTVLEREHFETLLEQLTETLAQNEGDIRRVFELMFIQPLPFLIGKQNTLEVSNKVRESMFSGLTALTAVTFYMEKYSKIVKEAFGINPSMS